MSRLARFWPPLLLLGLLLAVFAGVLVDGRVLAVGDGLAQDFPLRLLVAQAWHQGIVPFWDPFDFGGMPLLAAIHVGVFFPGNLPFLCLPPIWAMNVTELLALWTGGVGAYLLARAQPLSRVAAFASGLVFMSSGFMVAHIENLQMLQAAALMPWVLWAIARHQRATDERYAVAFAALLALQVLAGHPQMVVFTGLVAVPYALYLAAGRARGTRLAYLLPLGLAGLLGLALAALQLAPTLDFIPRTQRTAIGYDVLTFRSLPPRQLIAFWVPYFFGGYGTWLAPLTYWGGPHQTELAGYAGLATLVLAVLALMAGRERPVARFWAVVALAGTLLALGDATHLYDWWASLPLLRSLPAPGRHLLETDLALALLAGYGLEALGEAAAARRALVAWGLAGLPLLVVAVAVATRGASFEARLQPFMPDFISLAGWFSLARPTFWLPIALWLGVGVVLAPGARVSERGRAVQRLALVALLAVDLGLFALNQGWAVRSPRLPHPPVAPAPALVAGEARIWPISSVFVYPYDDFASLRALRYPNWGGLVGVRSITGYDAFIPVRYARLMGRMESTGLMNSSDVWLPGHHGLALMGVRTLVVDPVAADYPGFQQIWRQHGLQEVPGEPRARHFLVPGALPRAWRLETTLAAPPLLVERHVRNDTAFDPARTGYLDVPDAATGRWAPGTASAHASDFNTIQLETDGTGPGFVAVDESYSPGWRAYLQAPAGERELDVHCLDALVMGVQVPAGRQRVVLRYEPRAWRGGLALSLLALLVLAGWGAREWRRGARR